MERPFLRQVKHVASCRAGEKPRASHEDQIRPIDAQAKHLDRLGVGQHRVDEDLCLHVVMNAPPLPCHRRCLIQDSHIRLSSAWIGHELQSLMRTVMRIVLKAQCG